MFRNSYRTLLGFRGRWTFRGRGQPHPQASAQPPLPQRPTAPTPRSEETAGASAGGREAGAGRPPPSRRPSGPRALDGPPPGPGPFHSPTPWVGERPSPVVPRQPRTLARPAVRPVSVVVGAQHAPVDGHSRVRGVLPRRRRPGPGAGPLPLRVERAQTCCPLAPAARPGRARSAPTARRRLPLDPTLRQHLETRCFEPPLPCRLRNLLSSSSVFPSPYPLRSPTPSALDFLLIPRRSNTPDSLLTPGRRSGFPSPVLSPGPILNPDPSHSPLPPTLPLAVPIPSGTLHGLLLLKRLNPSSDPRHSPSTHHQHLGPIPFRTVSTLLHYGRFGLPSTGARASSTLRSIAPDLST